MIVSHVAIIHQIVFTVNEIIVSTGLQQGLLSPASYRLALITTAAIFVGVYAAAKLELRAGAADDKLMVGLAAFAPLALGIGALLELVIFAALRLRGRRDAAIPGALWLYVGSLVGAIVLIMLAVSSFARVSLS